MDFSVLAGIGGIGFVVGAIAVNLAYVGMGLPQPASGASLDAVTESYGRIGDALRRPSVLAPVLWLCTTLFAAGLLSALWDGGRAWALVGFAGVLMQNATFTGVEALRFGMAAAAGHGRGAVAGLWGLSNVLFGFNQVFLAIAMTGFTAAGAGLIPVWQAVLGYGSAALLFLSSLAAPYAATGRNRLGLAGLIGWLGWATWIVVYSVLLIRR